MNTLSNGAIAVGQEGSWMRLQCAYEHELEKALHLGILRLNGSETVADRAAKMLEGILTRTATAGVAMKAAAKVCGINPNETSIRQYLTQANPNR
jgi:hypothetical protein